MIPNKRATYVRCDIAWPGCCSHAAGEPEATYDDFYDPELAWRKDKTGAWFAAGMFGGEILDSWWRANPRPA